MKFEFFSLFLGSIRFLALLGPHLPVQGRKNETISWCHMHFNGFMIPKKVSCYNRAYLNFVVKDSLIFPCWQILTFSVWFGKHPNFDYILSRKISFSILLIFLWIRLEVSLKSWFINSYHEIARCIITKRFPSKACYPFLWFVIVFSKSRFHGTRFVLITW